MILRFQKLMGHKIGAVIHAVTSRALVTGLRLGLLAYAFASVAELPILPGTLEAVEWSTPPGINVAAQEKSLKEQVTRSAASYVGKELVDVIVHIGYVRTGGSERGQDPGQIKLPGFESYISAGEAQEEIVSAFARLRQVFVMISSRATVRPEALARQVASAAGMAPDQGDSLRVIVTDGGGQAPEATALEDKPKPKPKPKPDMKSLDELNQGLAQAELDPEPDPIKEAKSTVFLIKARRSYFRGNFQLALDQILQAIAVDPTSAQAFAMLGSLYYAMNWKNLAIKYWQRSLEFDPSNQEIEDLVSEIRMELP